MKSKLFIAALAVVLPTAANAGVIKQRPFDYSFDVAKAAENDLFVICSNSPDDRITMLPAPPKLAMRLSQNEVQREEFRQISTTTTETGKEGVNCLLGTIQFQLDSSILTEKEKTKIDELVRNISAGLDVKVDGYTCDLGGDSHNLSLSLQRANAVASYLSEKHISVGNVEGKGKCCPVSDDRHLNRRVEITTQKRGGK